MEETKFQQITIKPLHDADGAPFLTALILFSYYGSALIEGKNPFVPYGNVAKRVTAGPAAANSIPAHKRIRKAHTAKSD
jgi:hypothetical protein